MTPEEKNLDMLVAELDRENRLLRARNERLEKELADHIPDATKMVEQPARPQEPVAFAIMKNGVCLSVRRFEPVPTSAQNDVEFVPLYAAPLAKKRFNGLTDKEFEDIIMSGPNAIIPVFLWQLIQDKLREKNQ